MTTNPTDQQFSIIVTKPGYDDTRIGPFDYEYAARSFAHSLNQQMDNTTHPEGTAIAFTAYDGQLSHTPVPPSDADTIAMQMDDDPSGDGSGANFPDLYTRLAAHYGYEKAGRLWQRACSIYDAMNAPEAEEQPSEADELRERVRRLEAAVSRLSATTGCRCPDQPPRLTPPASPPWRDPPPDERPAVTADPDPAAVRLQARASAFGAAADMLDAHLAAEGHDPDCTCGTCPACTIRDYRGLLHAIAAPGTPDSPKPVPATCEGGIRTPCPRRPAWKAREKGDHLERNWVYACPRHLHHICAEHGERADIDITRIGI